MHGERLSRAVERPPTKLLSAADFKARILTPDSGQEPTSLRELARRYYSWRVVFATAGMFAAACSLPCGSCDQRLSMAFGLGRAGAVSINLV